MSANKIHWVSIHNYENGDYLGRVPQDWCRSSERSPLRRCSDSCNAETGNCAYEGRYFVLSYFSSAFCCLLCGEGVCMYI